MLVALIYLCMHGRDWVMLATYFSLITMVIPFWQCFPCAQYSHMGFVSLIMIVYVGVMAADADTGIYPELRPVMLLCCAMGAHGLSNVDWVTV